MKLFPKDDFVVFRQDKTIKLANRIYVGVLVFGLLVFLLSLRGLPPQIPLFYSLPWGDEQLASPILLLILPLGCLSAGIINLFLAVISFTRRPLAAKILVWFNVIIALLATFTLIRIIFLII